MKFLEAGHQFQVLVRRFLGEAETRIEDNGFPRDTRSCCNLQRSTEKMALIGDHVGKFLPPPTRMHDAKPGASLGCDRCDLRLALQPVHIVDDMGTGFDRRPSRRCAVGVDGDQCIRLLTQCSDNRHDTRDLLLGADLCGTRTRRFAADIQDHRALFDTGKRMAHGTVDRVMQPAIGEGIRSDIDDRHDRP